MPVLTLPSPDSVTARAKALVFEDARSRELLTRIELVAPSDATILLCGETGTGKEIVARHVHELSKRRGQPFVGVNSGTLPEALVESELFGHERGAFTGAVQAKAGWFETASGGTLFLDEIGDIPLATQVKLLRVLQEGEIVRVGGRTTQRVDVRLIAATNVDLKEAVRAGRFREDLYYRLNVAPLTLLPLRERPDDILPIAQHFLELYSHRLKLERLPVLSPEAIRALVMYPWPGNIRELENAVHHALLVGRGPMLTPEDFRLIQAPAVVHSHAAAAPVVASGPRSLETVFAELFEQPPANLFEHVIERLVQSAYWHCERNQVHTARLLGISRNVLRARLQQAGELRTRESTSPPQPARPTEPPPTLQVCIGYQRYGVLPLLKASGLLERSLAAASVKLSWREYVGGMQLIEAFQSDGLTFGLVGEVPPIFAQAARLPMLYLAAEAPAPDQEAIVVPVGSELTNVESLRGKTVLLSRGSNVQYFLTLALEAAGLTYADIHVVYAPPDRAEAMFASGQVDAWATWEPFLGRALRAGSARVLRSARGLTANTSYYVGSRSFVTEHPELVSVFLDQLREVARWAEVQPGQAAALMAAELGLPLAAASEHLSNIRAPEVFDSAHMLAQQNIADTFHRLGIVDARIDVKLACWRRPATGQHGSRTRPGAQAFAE